MHNKNKDNDLYSYYCCLTNFLNGKEISDIKRHEDIIYSVEKDKFKDLLLFI